MHEKFHVRLQGTEKCPSSLGGLEPPTFRLTAERANQLRHRDSHGAGHRMKGLHALGSHLLKRDWNGVFPPLATSRAAYWEERDIIVTPNVGLEPTTLRLRVSCSTD